jgi:hypothetical protein
VKIVGFDRKCRSETCGKWSNFEPMQIGRTCTFCGADYGPITLGLDVELHSTPERAAPRAQARAMIVPKPRKGEFGG